MTLTLTLPDTRAVHYVAQHLRASDRDELRAVHGAGVDFVARVRQAVLASEDSRVLLAPDGEPVALIGVAPVSLLSGVGCPWALGTDRVAEFPRDVVQIGRERTALWASRYSRLVNFVDARNTRSLRWLRAIGFEILPAQPFGAAWIDFHRIEGGRVTQARRGTVAAL